MREGESQRGDPRPAEAEVPTGWEQTVQTSIIVSQFPRHRHTSFQYPNTSAALIDQHTYPSIR